MKTGPKPSHQPRRTCIGCRQCDDQIALLRLILNPESAPDTPSVAFDLERNRGGRGAWLHPQHSCLERALKTRGFNRAFRGAVDVSAVAAEFAQATSTINTVRDQHESGSKI